MLRRYFLTHSSGTEPRRKLRANCHLKRTTNPLPLREWVGYVKTQLSCILFIMLTRHVSANVGHLQVTKVYIEVNYIAYNLSISAYSKLSKRSRRLDYTTPTVRHCAPLCVTLQSDGNFYEIGCFSHQYRCRYRQQVTIKHL